MSEIFEPKVGICAMHHMHERCDGTLVYIDSETGDGWFSIRYIPYGGGSSSWPAKEFRPITDPVFSAVAKSYMARKDQQEHLKKAAEAAEDVKKWDGVAQVLKELNCHGE